MLRVALVFLALQAASVLSTAPDAELPAAEHDDECLASGPGGCALSALQKRGAKVSAALAERDDGMSAALEELELLDPDVKAMSSMEPDLSRHVAIVDTRQLKHNLVGIQKASKVLTKVEASVNETYTMTVKELSPDKDSSPPPMPKKSARSSHHRRRHHSAGVHLAPRQKKVSHILVKSEGAMGKVWARIKRCSDMMVYTEKRITGGELESAALLQASGEDGGEAESAGEDEAFDEDGLETAEAAGEDEEASNEDGLETAEALGEDEEALDEDAEWEGDEDEDGKQPVDGSDTVGVKSATDDVELKSVKEDLKHRIKQLSKETKDAIKDIKKMAKRAIKLRKLFKDTYRNTD